MHGLIRKTKETTYSLFFLVTANYRNGYFYITQSEINYQLSNSQKKFLKTKFKSVEAVGEDILVYKINRPHLP